MAPPVIQMSDIALTFGARPLGSLRQRGTDPARLTFGTERVLAGPLNRERPASPMRVKL